MSERPTRAQTQPLATPTPDPTCDLLSSLLAAPGLPMFGDPAPLRCPVLVGRDREIASVTRLMERSDTGTGSLLAITGYAGIGKSALVREVLRRWPRPVLVGRATPSSVMSMRPLSELALACARAGVDLGSDALELYRGAVDEYEVLSLIAERLTNREIVDRLVVSPSTVKRHVESLLAKTGWPTDLNWRTSPKTVVTEAWAESASGNIQGLLDRRAEDSVVHDYSTIASGLRGDYEGPARFAGLFSALDETAEATAHEIIELVGEGDTVVSRSRLAFRVGPTDTVYDGPMTEVYKVRDGLIVGCEFHSLATSTGRHRLIVRRNESRVISALDIASSDPVPASEGNRSNSGFASETGLDSRVPRPQSRRMMPSLTA